MAIKDAKELSMDEILASIRSILHESENVRHADTEGERCVIPSVQTVSPAVSECSETQHPEFEMSEKTAPAFEPKTHLSFADNMQEDVTSICNNIQKLMQQPVADDEEHFTITVEDEPLLADTFVEPELPPVDELEQPVSAISPIAPDVAYDDISLQIIDSFAAIFAERRQSRPLVDTSARELAESAVINEVVPVLVQWLNECLPDIIRKEIERVMAKAGNR